MQKQAERTLLSGVSRSTLVSTLRWGSSSSTMADRACRLPATNFAISDTNWESTQYTAHTAHPCKTTTL